MPLICVGMCFHVSCILPPNARNHGEYFWLCHGYLCDCVARTRHGIAPKNMELIPVRSLDDHTVKHQCQIVQQRMEGKLREKIDWFAAGTEVKRKEFAWQFKIALVTFDIKSRQALRSRGSDFRHGKVQDHFTTIISKTHIGSQDKLAGVAHKPDTERNEIRRHRFNVHSLETELIRAAQMALDIDMRIKRNHSARKATSTACDNR